MGSDKIFMFDNPAAGESAGIMSMIPALLQNKGLDPNLVAALMNGNKNQDAWGGAGCYWIWIILLFFLWGGNGFGNGFGNGANGIPAQLNNEAGRELLMNAIQGNGTAINQLASSLNCSTQQLQNAICLISLLVNPQWHTMPAYTQRGKMNLKRHIFLPVYHLRFQNYLQHFQIQMLLQHASLYTPYH